MNRLWLSATLVIICLAIALPAGATAYYVSPSGSDASGDGSQGRPWRTIQKAADKMSAGDTCHVMDGNYDEMVRPARSGTAGHYISFVAEGQSVWLNGTRRITGWMVHSGNIWKASAAWDFGELYVDRQRMVLARWPNLTSGDIYRPDFYQATANGGDTSIIDSVHLTQSSGFWNGAKIFMVPGLGWTAEQYDVTDYSPAEHRIFFSRPHYEYYDVDQYSLYFLYDMLSLLDAPSEWFLDRAADTVYLWLPDGGNPSGHLVEASGGSGGFNLTDRSYIRVAGFKLMSGDIKMLDAKGCLVEEVRHLYPATELSVSGSDNEITRSEIAYASYNGVKLDGMRNTLSKCHVHHCNYFGTWNAIVELNGSQNSITDCSLHDAGRDGVSIVGGLDVSGCIIEHNEIYNTGLIAKDCGGFYSYDTKGAGTVIRYNIFHDIWPKESPQYGPIALGYGIYLDENSSDFSVHHNVAYRTAGYAIMLHQASRNNLVYNNTAVGSGGGWGDVINSSPGGNWFGVDGTVVANNLAVMLDDRQGWCINFESEIPAYHHNGYYNVYHSDRLNSQGVESTGVTGNPLFACAVGNDFSLLAGSPMIDKGVVIPGITDGYVGTAPDIGAYEQGGSKRPGPRDKWWMPSQILTIQSGTEGTTSPSPGAHTYDKGSIVCVRASADYRYRFLDWSGDATGTANPLSVLMDRDKTIKANFLRQYVLTIIAGVGGTTSPAPGTHKYDTGSNVQVTAEPNTYFYFKNWGEADAGTTNPVSILMNGDKTLLAFFKLISPPNNFSGRKVFNRSLSQAEYINILSWAANPDNENIASYKIYLVEGNVKTELASLDANTFTWMQRNVGKSKQYTYQIVAVNSGARAGMPATVEVL